MYVDQTELTTLHNGESVQVIVSVGLHRLNSNDKSTGIDLDAKAGQTYYMRVDIKTEAWRGHGAITLIDAQEGKYEFSQQKLALTRDLSSNPGTIPVEASKQPEPSAQSASSPQITQTVSTTVSPKLVLANSVEGFATVSVVTLPDGAEILCRRNIHWKCTRTPETVTGEAYDPRHTVRV